MRVILDSSHFFSQMDEKFVFENNRKKFLNFFLFSVLKFFLFFTILILIINDQFFFRYLFSSISIKKSCPELPDLKFKGRVNPDTPISQINKKTLPLPLQVFIICLSSFTSRNISYKSQFIKSLPVISNTRQPAIETVLPSMSLSKNESKHVCCMKWHIIHSWVDFNSFWWFEKLLNILFNIYFKWINQMRGKTVRNYRCPELPGLPVHV